MSYHRLGAAETFTVIVPTRLTMPVLTGAPMPLPGTSTALPAKTYPEWVKQCMASGRHRDSCEEEYGSLTYTPAAPLPGPAPAPVSQLPAASAIKPWMWVAGAAVLLLLLRR